MSGDAARKNLIELAVMYLVIILFSLGGIIWDIASRLLINGIDGIFLLLVCLAMGGVFTLELLVTLTHLGVIPAPKFLAGKSAPAAPAKPAAPAPAGNPAPNPAPRPEGK